MIKIFGIDSKHFVNVSLEEVLEYLSLKEEVQFDIETDGLDPHRNTILCFQFGDFENQYVINGDLIQLFKKDLERLTLLGHNIKFDIRFLYKQGIYPTKVYDTFLAECVISCGIKSQKRNLAAVANKRLGINLDKSVRDDIWRIGLTKEVIEYAAEDVKWLEKIRESQIEDIKYHDLKHAVEVENQFVVPLAYVEFCGMKLDVQKWKNKMEGDYNDFLCAKNELDNFLKKNHPNLISNQIDIFTGEVETGINWASSKQVINLFKKIGIPVHFIIRGEEKESVEAKNIGKYIEKYEIIKLYLKYKECEKEVTTYGENFLNQINPVTGRLHTNFKQVLDTGRISSGGKDKKTKTSFINFQNIPADKETRACFVAESGNVLIGADYSGQEQIVLANRSLDKGLLDFYDNKMGDMHSFVASKMYEDIKDKTLDEIKEFHKDKRQNAKTAGFAINYGGNGATIARNNNLTEEEGEAIYNAYFTAFPGLREYFEEEKKKGLIFGYIQFNDIIKTKSFIEGYDEFLSLQQTLNRGFWDRWKVLKQTPADHFHKVEAEFKEMKSKISKYFKIKGAIERKALNYPIQGSSATITKIAVIYFFKWLRSSSLLEKVLITNMIHDEILVECPKEQAEEVSKNLKNCMIKSGSIFCKRVPLTVDVTIDYFWKK